MEHFPVLAILVIALVLFVTEWLRADLVALGVALSLAFVGIITPLEAFSGFSNPAVITVIGMFILSAGLVNTGVADWIGSKVLGIGGSSPVMLTILVMLTSGLMSAFMNNIGAVAVLMPAMFSVAAKTGYPVARLLMPLSFGSLLGGLITVIGTPPNLLVSAALVEAGHQPFKMFDFAPTGFVVLAVGITYMVLIGRHLIPVRDDGSDLSKHFDLSDYLAELIIPEKSALAGKSLAESRLREDYGLAAIRIRRANKEPGASLLPLPDVKLEPGDRILVQGALRKVLENAAAADLKIHADESITDQDITGDDSELAEAVIAPGSDLVGQAIRDLDVRRRLGLAVLGVKRRGKPRAVHFESMPLESGDVLLLQGQAKTFQALASSDHFLLISKVVSERKLHSRALLAVGILAMAVLAAALGWLHISVSAMTGALLMAVTGCLKIEKIYEAVDWKVIFLIAGMLPLGLAMDSQHAGTAAWLAGGIVYLVGDHGPLVVMAGLFLFTMMATEVMSNAAAAVLLAPIGIAIAAGLGLEPYPFLMAVAIGASSTFLSPIGHQSNMLIYGVGNYRFTDFARAGAPLNALVFAVVLLVVPVVWPFVQVK